MCIALRIERVIRDQGPIVLGVSSFIAGFILCVMSSWVGVGYLPAVPVLEGMEKDLGFIAALNWSVTFLILFPMFMVFFAMQVNQCALIRHDFAELQVISGQNGAVITSGQLEDDWTKYMQSISNVYWILLVAVVIQTASDWWMSCGRALSTFVLRKESLDWSTAVVLLEIKDSQWDVLAFSLSAYFYMGAALFTYLSALVYSLAFAYFLYNVSTRVGHYRLIFKKDEIIRGLSAFFNNIYWAIFMGLCAAFLMRLQSGYLISDFKNVGAFLFQDWGLARKILNGDSVDVTFNSVTALGKLSNPSHWTSLALACFSLLSLTALTYALLMIFSNAKNYFPVKIHDANWRRATQFPDQIDALSAEARNATFVPSIIPNAANMLALVTLLVISMILLGIGTLFIAVILYALVQSLIRKVHSIASAKSAGSGSGL